MQPKRDPVERSADDGVDLYDVSTWEPRSVVDYVSYALYTAVYYGLHWIVVLAAVAITIALLALPAATVADQPVVGVFIALSIVPALALAGYIWYADVTTTEPLHLLVATFLLAVVFATFAAVVNSIFADPLQSIPIVGFLLFFYLIVGPVEEAVKLLAVRVLAFRSRSFDAVVDGAVYGAVAGLGFAAIENALYISGFLQDLDGGSGLFVAGAGIGFVRLFAGPGHVIYSAIAGYYLGLAKFNPEQSGPLVVKGLFVAAVIHATYNVTVGIVPTVVAEIYPTIPPEVAFVGYVIVYDLLAGYYLYRKLSRYHRAYRDVRADAGDKEPTPELTEFDPSSR